MRRHELLCSAWGSKAPSAVTGPSAPRIYELGARVRTVVASRRPGRARTRPEHELGPQGARPSFRAAAGINCGGGVYERGGDLLKVLVTGRRGKMARGLVRALVEGGHEVRGLVRKEERLPVDVEPDGAEPVLWALQTETVEGGVGEAGEGCDAIVFAAGDPASGSPAIRPYLLAKVHADVRLRGSGLDYNTIVRLGSPTAEEGAGRIEAAEHLGRRGKISREDVARTLALGLERPNTSGKTLEILAIETPVEEALAPL